MAMSSGDSTHSNERLDTRFSTPAPELDDHRRRRPNLAPQSPEIPSLEVQHPTPRPSVSHADDITARLDEALKSAADVRSPVNARDFEQAIDDGEELENDAVSPINRGIVKQRQFTNRAGRPRDIIRRDRSRDSSSSSSSSPANSIEAFAEPRRRARANTIDSRASSPSFRQRGYSDRHSRRPTLSQISIPGIATQRTDRDAEERMSFVDDEPGKTLKIDYEELEEFVALCKQGKISDAYPSTKSEAESSEGSPQVFADVRPNGASASAPNVALNGENFYEKPLTTFDSSATKVQRFPTVDQPQLDRFTFFSSEVRKPIQAPRIGGLLRGETTFRDLFDVADEGGVWWLDVQNPTRAELDVIAKAFKIHRLTREDIEMQEPREKVELFPQYYFVCFRSFNMNKHSEDFLDPIHVYIVVCADGVVSFSYTPNPHAKNVRRRINKLGDFVSLGPDYICYAMIDDIVDCFAPIIRDAEQESEDIEDQVFIARQDDLSALLKKIGICRKRVLNMMRLLGGKADVIRGFAKRCNDSYDMTPRGDIGLYLGDIQDHVVTMMSNLGHVEKMLSRSHANYLAQLNVDSIMRGNGVNKNLTKITVVATILVPLNLITGLFGMNVHIPGQDGDNLGWFFGILGFIALFVSTALLVAKKRRII